jgi:hypothetical protein
MKSLKKIAVTGSYSQDQSLVSLSLSLMTGLPLVKNKSLFEIAKDLSIEKKYWNFGWADHYATDLAMFSDTIAMESKYPDGFVSNASAVNELIITKAFVNKDHRAKYGLKEGLHHLLSIPYRNQYRKMTHSMERIISDHIRETYDQVVHLTLHPFRLEEFNKNTREIMTLYNSTYIDFYERNKVNYMLFDTHDMIQTLSQMNKELEIHSKVKPESVYYKAQMAIQLGDDILS